MVSYENFYEGTPSSLDAEYGDIFTGYRTRFGDLGGSTSIQTANQLQEVSNLLSQGMKAVEVSAINEEVLEMIPDKHLEEINRLTKLTGSEVTLHAPVTDPSGFTQQGWAESEREETEIKLKKVIERAHLLNPDGNIPVSLHSSNGPPGSESIPWKNEQGEIQRRMIAVERETGRFVPLQMEKLYHPENIALGKERVWTTEERLESLNNTDWKNKIDELIIRKERGDELINQSYPIVHNISKRMSQLKSEKEREQFASLLKPMEKEAYNKLIAGETYLEDTYLKLKSNFENAYKNSDNEQKKALKEAAERFIKEGFVKVKDQVIPLIRHEPVKFSEAINHMLSRMHEIDPPKSFVPIEDFVKDKASITVANAALHGWKKFKDTAPIVSIENPPYGSAVSRGRELKELVEASQKRFVENAVRDKLMSRSEAEKTAKKLIGVTWDTSHISMLRKQGFDEKKLVEEAKHVAPLVKHFHFNDNLGTTHTDLPPGMGSVPIKDIMKEFEKAGFKGKKIFEGGNFVQQFKVSPFPYLLEGVGPEMYGSIVPYWNQISGIQGHYSAGFGTYLPEQHFSLYGSGFSGLPQELGGQIPGRQSRFSGTPNA